MVVIFLHGFGGTPAIWNEIIPLLEPAHEYICLDYSRISFCQTIEEYADWVHSKIEELNITRFTLIAHSMGGYIALAYAEKYKKYLAGLGLVHSTVFEDSEERKSARLKTAEFIDKNGTEVFISDFLPKMYNPNFRKINQVYIEKQFEANKSIPKEALMEASKSMGLRPNRSHVLKSLKFPVLLLIGTQDEFISYNTSLEMIPLVANPYILILDSVAHAGMVEEPVVCAAFFNSYLKEVI
jgi:pimeloyl-ACP methyl ester carboxylesterase